MIHKSLQGTFKKVRSYSFATNGILKHSVICTKIKIYIFKNK